VRLAGKKILLVVAPRDFRDEELFVTRAILERAGATLTLASLRTGQVRGMLGGRATATALVDGVPADRFDAIGLIGGDGAREHLWPSSALRRLVLEADGSERVLGAICLAPVVLARAGLVAGRDATVWPATDAEDELRRAGAHLVREPWVRAGRVLTASGPQATESFAAALVDALTRARG